MQASLQDLRLGGVALVAMLDQERTHLLLEELPFFGADCRLARGPPRVGSQRYGSRSDGPAAEDGQQDGDDPRSKAQHGWIRVPAGVDRSGSSGRKSFSPPDFKGSMGVTRS